MLNDSDMAGTADRPATLTSRQLVDQLDRSALPARRALHAVDGVELRIGILLWPGFPLLSLAGLCDGLRHAADVGDQSRQNRCSWAVLGVPGECVPASCGVRVPVDQPFDDVTEFDYLAVIGGLLGRDADVDRRYVSYLRQADARGVPLIGICTGSFVLAELGLLEGHTPCIHPFHVEDWKARHPVVPYETRAHYAFSPGRITCPGGISIVELVAELVHLHCGADRAAKVVHQMTVDADHSATHVARRHALGYEPSDHKTLRQAIVLMEKNIATPLEIAVIARLVKTSSRQLERVFLNETGASPSEYYRRTRLRFARWLLVSSDLPVSAIAHEAGFSDASHFIRHFQQLYGLPPGRLRKALSSEAARA